MLAQRNTRNDRHVRAHAAFGCTPACCCEYLPCAMQPHAWCSARATAGKHGRPAEHTQAAAMPLLYMPALLPCSFGTHLILNHSNAAAMVLCQDVVEQGL